MACSPRVPRYGCGVTIGHRCVIVLVQVPTAAKHLKLYFSLHHPHHPLTVPSPTPYYHCVWCSAIHVVSCFSIARWFDRQTSHCLFITIKAICINAILLSQSMYNICHLPAGSLFSHVTTCDLAAIASHIACRFVQIASSIAGPARGSINDSDGYHSTRRFGVSRVNKISWSR